MGAIPGPRPDDLCGDREASASLTGLERCLLIAWAQGFEAGFDASAEGWNGEHPTGEDVTIWVRNRARQFAERKLAHLTVAAAK